MNLNCLRIIYTRQVANMVFDEHTLLCKYFITYCSQVLTISRKNYLNTFSKFTHLNKSQTSRLTLNKYEVNFHMV